MDDQVTLRILSASFGLWALVVGWGVHQITRRIDEIGRTVKELDNDLQRWVNHVERRLSKVEERVYILCAPNGKQEDK